MKRFFVLILVGMVLLLAACGRGSGENMALDEFAGPAVRCSEDAPAQNGEPSGQTAAEGACGGGEVSGAEKIKRLIRTCYNRLSDTLQQQMSDMRSYLLRIVS